MAIYTRKRALLGGAIVIVLLAAALIARHIAASNAADEEAARDRARTDIVARGHIEPESRVLNLQGPAGGGVVQELKAGQGDQVKKGQVLALLEGNATQAAGVAEAERALNYSRMVDKQVAAGAKKADIEAQKSVIEAKKADLARTQNDLKRQEMLFGKQMISAQAIDRARTENDIAQAALEQARHSLVSLNEVRGVDQNVANAKVAVDEATLQKARAELDRTILRAPIDGTVLSIATRQGEAIGPDGIMRIAALDRLIVVAEVDEHFMPKLGANVHAVIGGPLLAQPVQAKVRYRGQEIFRQARPISDTLMGRDARIVEVELEPAGPLPLVLGGEVEVRFVAGAM
ncbi:HlyD family efflux transporter periplasmic adaptor subunit [Oxalobacteraceae bacterium CAVE-383]|nr:HlyD family efflux transporter periplasmic adaptor subunit [Oxalobacteraceae bacterium CAVE-383]